MNYYLQYILIRILAGFLTLMPAWFSFWCGRRAGDFIFFFMVRRRKIALENIHKVFGTSLPETKKRQIARESFQSMAVSLIELFIVKKIQKEMEGRFTLEGNEHLREAFAKGKGIVLVISHLGSWEYLSFLPRMTGQPWSVVVRDIRNPHLNNYIEGLRLSIAVIPIPKVNSVRPILKELKANHGVAILIDQWAGGEGIWMDFFDIKTSTTSIPARLAEKTGCALIPAYCLRESSGQYKIHIHPPLFFNPSDEDWEKSTTQELNSLLEKQIRKYPEQWLWGHRRWKKEPAQMRGI